MFKYCYQNCLPLFSRYRSRGECDAIKTIFCFQSSRTFYVVSRISIDYKWNLWGLENDTEEYRTAMQECHERTGARILEGCLKNGGLYIKLGQVLLTANYILPKPILTRLSVLHDRALARKYKEVGFLQNKHTGLTERSYVM